MAFVVSRTGKGSLRAETAPFAHSSSSVLLYSRPSAEGRVSQEEASAVTPDVHVDVHVHVHVHVGVVVGVGDDMFFTSSVVCHVILCARSVEGNRAVVRNRKRRWESKGGREGGRGNGGEEKKAEIMRNFRKSTRPGKTTKEQQAEASRRTSDTGEDEDKDRVRTTKLHHSL